MLPCEHVFLLAISETHPGSRNIDKKYINALKCFIKTFVRYSFPNNDIPEISAEIYDSRYKLRKWMQKITHTHNHKKFKECTM